METIKRKSGLRYREEVTFNKKRIKGPLFKRKTDAKEWKKNKEAEIYSSLKNGIDPFFKRVEITFEDYSKKWLYEIKMPDIARKTFLDYESKIRVHLNPRFGKHLLGDISEEEGRSFQGVLKKRHNPKGVNDILGLFKSILYRAKRDKLILENPLEFIGKVKNELKCDAFWTRREIRQFFLSNRFNELYPLFFVAVHTGMRKGELCGLLWDRVDFERNQITVSRIRDKEGLKETTKTNLKRIIPITEDVKEVLQSLLKKQTHLKFVFAKRNGNPIDYGHLYRDFKIAQKRAGFTKFIRFHDLRHTFASQFVMNGGNLFDLQKILGHSKIEMTMKYAHYSEEYLQGSVRFMEMGLTPDLTHRKISV